MVFSMTDVRPLPVSDRWCVHAYYTVCPYAPDGSGRLLLAGTDLQSNTGEVLVLDAEGQVIDRFGQGPLNAGFFHTGFWQTWSPDARYVYFQRGEIDQPQVVRRELATGREWVSEGDVQGAPPDGEPLLSGMMGMMYAAGYSSGEYRPDLAPAPFQAREQHGLFSYSFEPPHRELVLPVSRVLAEHPQRDLLLAAEREVQQRLGADDGLTLMAYALRWAPNAERFLFYFGNHTVTGKVPARGEPKLAYIFTARRDFSDLHLALDLGFGKPGVHWGWYPDGEHLIGYGPDPDDETRRCLASVRYDGRDYRRLSRHDSGGHPAVSPLDPQLIVTDDTRCNPGQVLFIDTERDTVVARYDLPRVNGETEPPGRNPYRVCHHPVFDRSGKKVLVNTLPGTHAVVAEIDVPERC